MGRLLQRKGVRVARAVFRWCRIAVWFVMLLAVAALSYLYVIGLPDFLKPRLLDRIRQRGFEARFTSARLGWGPSIVIENAGFSPTNRLSGPRLSAGLTEVKLDWKALLHRHLKADSVTVLNGQVKVPVSERFGKMLSLDKVALTMRLSSNDFAQLSGFGATFHGIRIRIDGEVTNFASIGNWKWPAQWHGVPRQGGPSQAPAASANILDQIHLGQPARLDIHFSADGRDIDTLRAEAMLSAPGVETPWATTGRFQLRAAAAHLLDVTNRPFMQARLLADTVTTRWGTGENISLTAAFFPDSSTPFNALVNFSGDKLGGTWNSPAGTNWVRTDRLWWDGKAALSPANFRPSALEGTLRAVGAESKWGSAAAFSLALKADQAEASAPADPTWGIWTRFSPYVCSCHLVAANIQHPELRFESLAVDATWRAPQLAIEKLEARLYKGTLDGGADLDVASREVRLHAAADFDPHGVSQVLTPAAQRWLSQFAWQSPPAVNAQIRLVLPPWINRPESWRNELRASVQVAGDFTVGEASFRKAAVSSASAHFSYTNRVWYVPRLYAVRPEGSVDVDYTGNDARREYHVIFNSRLDPADALPLLEPRQQRLLRELHFSTPPQIRAEARGRWNDPDSIAFAATIQASNFTARGEAVDEARASVEYTNHFLRVSDLGLSQEAGRLDVPLVSADFESKHIFLTNAQSTLNPRILIDGLGTNAPEFLSFIHFDSAPTVRASGSFVLGNSLATDMRFEVHGENFHWTNLGADKISGVVQWKGRNVMLTNIDARLYNSGRLSGWLAFDSGPKRTAGFRSDFTAKNVDLGLLALGLTGKTSRLEGKLDGYMALNAPVTADKDAWAGHGVVHLHDALLWDIKIFGVLSPVLNAISPGAGESRARDASALFTIGDGKVSSDDLEIHSTGMRLLYRGSITMKKQINGKVEADLLRDTPVFGRVLSLALTPLSKLFEYQITGPLRQPVFKPLYVPKFIMLLLRPFHTLKNLVPETPSNPPPPKAGQ